MARNFITLSLLISISIFFQLFFTNLASGTEIEVFVSPDCSYSALEDFITGSSESMVLASYTFSSPEIMELLIGKKDDSPSIYLSTASGDIRLRK